MTDTDESLLNAFAGSRDERAFRALADRYLGLVFHTAMRRTNHRQIAEEVSQNILCALAQKASSLARNPDRLPAWLHRATLYESSKAMRAESSHQRRNRLHLPDESSPDDSPWSDAIPHLDAALDQLPDADRHVVLLHYFQNRSFPGIATSLGKSTVAIQKQSQRALDKLARLLRAKGVTLSAATVATGLTAEFAKAAPITLVQSATAAVLTGGATYSTTGLSLMFAAKSKVLVPLVILLCVLPLALQYQAIFALERKTTLLRAQLAAHDTAPGADPRRVKSAAKTKVPDDWKKISAELAEDERSGKGDSRILLSFEQRLLTMPAEELFAALDEINGLGLSGTKLENKLLQRLGQQAPELALTWSIDHVKEAEGRFAYSDIIAEAFEKTLKQDPAKAIRWFDQMIAAGMLVSKALGQEDQARTRMEFILVRNLLTADVAAVGRRLSALPDDQRTQVLDNVSRYLLNEQEQLAFARLVRDQLPQSNQVSCIRMQAFELVKRGGLAKVSEYLERIDASPVERNECVLCAASQFCSGGNDTKVTRDDVEATREWVQTQAPDLPLDRVMGPALAQAARVRTVGFIAAAELALQYSQDCGNEEVLGQFLDSYVQGYGVRGEDAEQVRTLAGKLSDTQRRDRILAQLK